MADVASTRLGHPHNRNGRSQPSLHWPQLDEDHSVPGPMNGVSGTAKWLAARAGRGTSEAKACERAIQGSFAKVISFFTKPLECELCAKEQANREAGMINKPERSGYTIHDFLTWRSSSQLAISPRFQRRKVWGDAARSFLIDTLLLGFPVPPLYIRLTNIKGHTLPVREVVDGQQRMSAALDFYDGKFALSSNLNSPYAGLRFANLPQDAKDKVTGYSFICEVFQGISDEDVLSIFARLNTYSVRLNGQELRNGKFFGPFKQSAYALAYSHLTFWRNNKVFSEQAIARMSEVELTSELMTAMIAGMQDKKKSIDDFYKRFDSKYSQRSEIEKRYKRVVDEISEIMGDTLKTSQFRRTPLFYTMFLALYHRMYGIPDSKIPRGGSDKLASHERIAFRKAIDKLSSIVADARKDKIEAGYEAFVGASLRQTDNIRPRETRLKILYELAFA